MGFKLVRVDASEPLKISLPDGKSLIGRGKFLDCKDSRVSRHHGELEVLEDTVIIKAMHKNPCFYIKKGSKEVTILQQNNAVNLTNGDQFGLVPDSYWYELICCLLEDSIPNKQTDTAKDEVDTDYEADSPLETIVDDKEATQNVEGEKDTDSFHFELNESSQGNDAGPLSPTILSPDMEMPSTHQQEEQISNPADVESKSPESPAISAEKDEDVKTPIKRSLSPRLLSPNDEGKRIKTEPQSPEDVKPGPSVANDPAQPPPSEKPADGAPARPALPLRERCMYGADCYRRNPSHKATFSHPADADWGAGPRGVCPWGAACRRRQPRHWQVHEHPPAAQPPPPPPPPGQKNKRPQKRRPRNSTDDEDLEDSPKTDLIVTGKRQRKTVQREEWSSSEEEDPFQSDGSDEWQPSSGYTQSQSDNTQNEEN